MNEQIADILSELIGGTPLVRLGVVPSHLTN